MLGSAVLLLDDDVEVENEGSELVSTDVGAGEFTVLLVTVDDDLPTARMITITTMMTTTPITAKSPALTLRS